MGGVGGGSGASDFDPRVRGGGRLGEGLVGCVECIGLRRERGPTVVSETETSDEYTGYIAVIYLTVGQSNEPRMRRNLAGSLSTL